MELELLDRAFSVCRLERLSDADLSDPVCFLARTDEEISLVCSSTHAPHNAAAREDGFRALRIRGVLDFSLVGILSALLSVLAAQGISVFTVSTYNTDYILVRQAQLDDALAALRTHGHTIDSPPDTLQPVPTAGENRV